MNRLFSHVISAIYTAQHGHRHRIDIYSRCRPASAATGEALMEDEEKKLSTDDLVKILMDIYSLTEIEAQRALKAVTVRSGVADF
jgi:hypothetical protein